MSAGILISDWWLRAAFGQTCECPLFKEETIPREMTSPGSSSSDCNTDHLESLRTCIGNGVTDMVRNSVSVLRRCRTAIRRLTSNDIASFTYLPDNCALEHHEHEEGEKAVIPVFVEHPEGHAEYLKDEERSGSMLRK